MTADPDATLPPTPDDASSRLDAAVTEFLQASERGNPLDRAQWLARHADLADDLRTFLDTQDHLESLVTSLKPPDSSGQSDATVAPSEGRVATEAPARHFGDYELHEEIARGGMGVVYRARQLSLNRVVALKMILSGQLASPADVQRFRTEAEAAANLDHPNIVPIYEVGHHAGQHYFSMKLMEGGSLSARVPELLGKPREAARLMVAMARAVHHAHQRGILHRDLKPGNILLDATGEPHVTDFGLAKRVENDSALTQEGTIVGTPSYMPPEQAAARKDLTVAADIYSLGAILYEMLTGRPPFREATPLDTLLKVLDAEPPPPRSLDPAIDSDLEVICLECLHREPGQRYESAAGLANDLEHWLADEPIRARPPSRSERLRRWLRKRRRKVVTLMLGTVLPVVLVFVGLLGLAAYADTLMGQVELSTEGPGLIAEILSESGQIVQTMALLAQAPVTLPEGNYRLRLSRTGALSETYVLPLAPGEKVSARVALSAQHVWTPLTLGLDDGVEMVPFGRQPDILHVVEGNRVRRLEGRTTALVWERVLKPERLAALAKRPPGTLGPDRLLRFETTPSGKRGPRLVRPAPDLDGDGVPDLVWATPTLLALSGKTGEEMWWLDAELAGMPVVADVDGDGRPDLIVTRNTGEVMALAGATGGILWRETPGENPGLGAIRGAERDNHPFAWGWRRMLDPAIVGRVGGKPAVLALIAGQHLVGLDLKTGKPLWPTHNLGFQLVRPPEWQDLDGDGSTDLLALREVEKGLLAVEAVNLTTRQSLWKADLGMQGAGGVGGWFDPQTKRYAGWPPTTWPLVADLDGDGKPEVIFPHQPEGRKGNDGLQVREGATGKVRWIRTLRSYHFDHIVPVIERFLPGPDLDGDGHRDIYLATRQFDARGGETLVQVEALSGQMGQTLWSRLLPYAARVGPLAWWEAPLDGWPQLLVPLEGTRICVVSAGTGKLSAVLPGIDRAMGWDLEGDGISELLFEERQNWGSQLHALRGSVGERWRRLGPWRMATDLDEDGVPDLIPDLSNPNAPFVDVVGGKTGALMWREKKPDWLGGILSVPGSDRVLLWNVTGFLFLPARERFRPFSMLAGRDGQHLWQGDGLPRMDRFIGNFSMEFLPSGGKPVRHLLLRYEQNTREETDYRLATYSAEDGRLLWDRSLHLRKKQPGGWHTDIHQWACALTQGPDDVMILLNTSAYEQAPNGNFKDLWKLRSLNLSDGDERWHRITAFPLRAHLSKSMNPRSSSRESREEMAAPLLADLRGDGKDEVILSEIREDAKTLKLFVDCLHPITGKARWSWPASQHFQAHERNAATPARMVRLKSGRFVCAAGRDGPTEYLTLLDAWGKPRQRRPILREHPQDRFWVADLDGDGQDEVLSVSQDGQLVATRDGLEREKWRWRLPGSLFDVLAVHPAGTRYPATVVVWTGDDLWGLAGPTGKPRWRSRLPRPASGTILAPSVGPPQGEGGLPSVFARLSETALVALDAQAIADGKVQVTSRWEPTFGEDPDAGRPRQVLPWAVNDEILWTPLRSGVLFLVLFTVPLVLGRWALRRRAWRGGLLVMGYIMVVWGLGMGFRPRQIDLILQLGLPLNFLGTTLAAAAWRRQTRQVAYLLMGWLTLAGLMAVVTHWEESLKWVPLKDHDSHLAFARDSAGAAWQAFRATRYHTLGWYWIAMPAAVALGYLLLAGWLMGRGVRGIAWLWRLVRRM